MVRTVVVRSGTASRRTIAFCTPIASASAAEGATKAAYTSRSPGLDQQRREDHQRLDGQRVPQQHTAVITEPADQHAPDGGAAEKAGRGGQRRGQREARCAGGGEADEDDVPGHVGDEHSPKRQDADRIDHPGGHGQHQ
jgi:hypothetical protein